MKKALNSLVVASSHRQAGYSHYVGDTGIHLITEVQQCWGRIELG
jgi:hypothetical protein